MPEYIEREVAIKRVKEYALSVFGVDLDNSQEYAGRSLPENYCEGLYEATELIDNLPAADVAPVRHGRWIQPILLDDGHMHAECSNCHNVRIIDDYCSACGSIMAYQGIGG